MVFVSGGSTGNPRQTRSTGTPAHDRVRHPMERTGRRRDPAPRGRRPDQFPAPLGRTPECRDQFKRRQRPAPSGLRTRKTRKIVRLLIHSAGNDRRPFGGASGMNLPFTREMIRAVRRSPIRNRQSLWPVGHRSGRQFHRIFPGHFGHKNVHPAPVSFLDVIEVPVLPSQTFGLR